MVDQDQDDDRDRDEDEDEHEEEEHDEEDADIQEPLVRLSKDLRMAARLLSCEEAAWLADQYYGLQDARIRAHHQLRHLHRKANPGELIGWIGHSLIRFESAIKAVLGEFAAQYAVGQWLQAQHGIGPVLSAVLMAHFDIRKAKTVGHMWRFAGMDPTHLWLGRERATKLVNALVSVDELTDTAVEAIHEQSGRHAEAIRRVWSEGFATANDEGKKKILTGKAGLIAWLSIRPWNARLKSVCLFKAGESFVKQQAAEACYYGKLFRQKKDALVADNAAGRFADVAQRELDTKCAGGKMSNSARRKHWSEGRLCPQHLHDRARRWVVKLFISHLHHVMFWDYYQSDPPAPYIFEHPNGQDHRHMLLPPLWPGEYSGRSLRQLYGEAQ